MSNAQAGVDPQLQMYRVKVPKDAKKFSDQYNNQRYEINPGSEAFVPFGAIDTWFGNPFAVNKSDIDRARVAEHNRMKVRYGGSADEQTFDDNKPQVEVWSMEGERIFTVIDDPEGTRLSPAVQSQHESQQLQDQVNALQLQLQATQAAMEQMNARSEAEADNALSEVTIDSAANSEEPELVPVDSPDRPGQK